MSVSYKLTDGAELIVRDAVLDDAQGLIVHALAMAEESEHLTFGPGEFDMTLEDERAFLREIEAVENDRFFVGTLSGTIVANICFKTGVKPRLRHVGEISMSVRQAHWGKGIGGILLDHLIGWARNTQVITKVNLRVRTDHERALALYRSRDFEVEGTLRRELMIDGCSYDLHWMGLLI